MSLQCLPAVLGLASLSFASAICVGDKNASCATLSCGFCGKNIGGCLSSACDASDFDTQLTDCSGGQCHYACHCRNPGPPPSPPAPTPPSPPSPPTPPSPSPPSPSPPGQISKKGVTIGGLHCDGIQTGTVFYPSDTSQKYPLLSFAHGWTEGGGFTDGNYKNVLEAVAAAGYVVIAHHSGLVNECQAIYPGDQLRALAYVKETAEWSAMVDWSIKTGIYGHSMGGGATGDNAGRENAIKQHNIGAAVLLHPVATMTKTKIPAFYATGSADTICAPGSCESWSRTAAKPFIFAEMAGATHFECQSSEDGIPCPAGWTNYVINWFNCHLKGMQDECAAASAVCTHPTKRMTKTNCQTGMDNTTLVV